MSAVAQESAGGRVELEKAREVCPTTDRLLRLGEVRHERQRMLLSRDCDSRTTP